MRAVRLPMLLATMLAVSPLAAQDLAGTCHASSSYDVTVSPAALVFDRPSPAPARVQLHDGALRVDGAAVALDAESVDRLSLFERELRALVPRVREVARHGVDLAVAGMAAEAGQLGLSADTQAEFSARLHRHAVELKQRIADSHSTHDLQGDFASRYENEIAADLGPLVAGDLAQQAMSAAMNGDVQTATDLRERATTLATQLQPRMRQRMQALRPEIAALCPSIRRLAQLQQGVRDGQGRPLNLLEIAP